MKKIFSIFAIILYTTIVFARPSYAQFRTNSNTVETRVGNPVLLDGGWPLLEKSKVTQGINGPYDHYALYNQGLQSIDVANVVGTPIYSTFDGIATTVCEDGQTSCGRYTGCNSNGCGYGKHVVVTTTNGEFSYDVFFGHFSQIQVQQGQTITKGMQLGLMGTTGYSTGPHLHWEFRNLVMQPPNIPVAITPLNCDSDVGTPCSPLYIPTDTSPPASQSYWFLLHRASNREELYRGTPGSVSGSTLVKSFNVKTGRPGERPTPLPQLVEGYGKNYWVIKEKHPETATETAPYFMTLNTPADAPYFGPTPYTECGGEQCNWVTSGAFGLHGVDGDNSRLSADNPGSSGCIRHTNEDITYLYNLLDPQNSEIRYYIEDN